MPENGEGWCLGVLGKAGGVSNNQVCPPASLSKNREYTWEGYMPRFQGRIEDSFCGELRDSTDSGCRGKNGENLSWMEGVVAVPRALKAQGKRFYFTGH